MTTSTVEGRFEDVKKSPEAGYGADTEPTPGRPPVHAKARLTVHGGGELVPWVPGRGRAGLLRRQLTLGLRDPVSWDNVAAPEHFPSSSSVTSSESLAEML